MGNLVFNTAKLRMIAGSTGEVDIIADTIKMALTMVDDDPDDPDIEFMGDFLGAGDAEELVATGYALGFGGAGRKTLASKTVAVDQANDRAEFDFANITWTALDHATNDIVGCVMLKEITNDAASPVLAKVDTATGLPLSLNGSDVTLTVDSEGFLHWT